MTRRTTIRPQRTFPSLLLALAAIVATERTAGAAVAYVRSDVGSPWDATTNEEALDLAFGAGGWDDLRFETVDPTALFAPSYTVIALEGGNDNALELLAFVSGNQAELEGWVSAGGDLFLNAAPTEGGVQDWGFGGVTLDYPNFSNDPVTAVTFAHPMWGGPFLPIAGSFTGNSVAHASVTGPGLVDLIQDADGDVHAAELEVFGSGRVIFGGLTASQFWDPNPEALNVRANLLAYLGGGDDDADGATDTTDNCPVDPNPLQEDADMDGIGDVCDACPADALNDADADLVCDGSDNCLALANPMQDDDDADGQGNPCDPCPADPDDDLEGDGVCGDVDNCPGAINPMQEDGDADDVGDACDFCPGDPLNDGDDDTVCDGQDNCLGLANPDQTDADGDGIGDACDDNGGTGGTTGDGSGSGGTGSDTATGADTTAGPGEGTTGPGDGTTGTDDDSTGGADPDAQGSSGCGCTSEPDGRGAWWALAIAALFVRRRARDLVASDGTTWTRIG